MSAILRLTFVCLILSLNSAAAQPNPGISVRRDFQSVPVHFEPNRGQSDPAAGFVARTATGLTAILRDGSVLLSRGGDRIGIRVAGSSSKPVLVPEGLQPGRSSYYLANQRIEGVQHYSRVRAKDVRPGMDVVYYGAGRLLEYDLVFRPGADPFKARLRFTSGVPVLNAEGELVLRSGTTEFIQRKPVAWQTDRRGGRTLVDCNYVLLASGDVRFRLGAYDRSRELTIDPVITYSTYLGGSGGYDYIRAIAVDASGAAVVAGTAESANFPVTSGVKPGWSDVFVTKFAPNGNSIQWSVFLGSFSSDYGNAVAVDAAGSVYVAGGTQSTSFAGTTLPSGSKGFVVKLSSQGVPIYVTALAVSSSSGGTQINGIAADANGNVWATGVTDGSVGTTGAYRVTSAGGQDAFVGKLTASGTVAWCTHVGGSNTDSGTAIAVDAAGNSHITGSTDSIDFPMVSPLDASLGYRDAFIATVNAAGTALQFSTYFGGSDSESGSAIAVDSTGRILVGGETSSADFLTTPAAFQPSRNNTYSTSGYIVSLLGGAQRSVEYSSYIGDSSEVRAVAIASSGRAVLAGKRSPYGNFPTTPGALKRTSPNYNDDAFLAEVSPGGSTLSYSTLLGGPGNDAANALALDSTGAAIVAGETAGGGFPTTPGAYSPLNPQTSMWLTSGWVSRIDLASPTLCQINVSPASINVIPQGGAFSFTITVPQGCPWEAVPDDRITMTTRSGMGTGAPVPLAATISGGYGYATTQRIQFGDATLTLNQPAWSCSDPAFTPSTLSFDSAGGIRTINAAFPSHCSWTAAASAPWISIQSGGAGYGTASISIYAAPNAFGARTGSVVVGGKSIPITQSAGACSSFVSADPATFGASGGSGTAAIVVTGTNCTWSAYSTVPWIVLDSTSGTGSGSVKFRVAQNPGSMARVGQLFVGDRQLTFTQAAGPSGSSTTYTQSTLSLGAGAGIGGIAVTPAGSLVFADNSSERIRQVDGSGAVTTLAGGGTLTGEGVPALSAQILSPWVVAVHPATGAVYFGDGARVRVIAGGTVATVAGTGTVGLTGDGGPATSAQIGPVGALAADSTGTLYIADASAQKIRRVSAGVISTFAGGGTAFADGVVPTATNLNPAGIAVDAAGAVYIADSVNQRIRKISNGVITTIAGGGNLTGSGVPALSASIFPTGGIAVDTSGAVYITDSSRIVKITPDGMLYAIDSLMTAFDLRRLLWFAAALVALSVMKGLFQYWMRVLVIGISRDIEYDLRNDLFRDLVSLSWDFFSKYRTGDIMARATNDLNAVRMMLGPGIMYWTETTLTMVLAIGIMFWVDWPLALVALAPAPVVSFVVFLFGRYIHDRFERIQSMFSDISSRVQENLAGVRVIRAYTQEEHQIEQFAALNREFIRENVRLARTQGMFMPSLQALIGIAFLGVLWAGGTRLLAGEITIGHFVMFNTYMGMLVWPMIALGWVVNLTQRGTASLERIDELMQQKPSIASPAAPKQLHDVRGEIEFDDVAVHFGGAKALNGVSMRIKAGSTVAIVGHTGSGKTTLVNLIPRMLDATHGVVRFDGHDVRSYEPEGIRRHIGFVSQETFLFSDTLAGNIAFGAPDATEDQIRLAARIAGLETDIETFPEGLQTMVGERGITLSGGQKQRTAIARAVVRDPKVLILDDALSSVDTLTEERILTALQDVTHGRTTILISHRVSTVRNADRIFVIEFGRVAEEGTHAELIERGGYYADLYQKQLLEEELEAI